MTDDDNHLPQPLTTTGGLNIEAYVRARIDGKHKYEAAELAGSKGNSKQALNVAARLIEAHPDYEEAKRIVRANIREYVMDDMIRILIRDANDLDLKPNDRHRAIELANKLMGNHKGRTVTHEAGASFWKLLGSGGGSKPLKASAKVTKKKS